MTIALVRRGAMAPTGRAPDERALGAWVGRALSLPFELPAQPAERVERLLALLQAAGHLELSGPERLLMRGDATLAAVPVERSLARDDDWPVCNADLRDAPSPLPERLYEPAQAAEEGQARGRTPLAGIQTLHELAAALHPKRFARMGPGPGDGARGWRAALSRQLAKVGAKLGADTNVGVLAAYARRRVRFGGRDTRRVAPAALANEVMRFAPCLLEVAGEDPILGWDAGQFQANYTATLLCTPVQARRRAFDALMAFHEYLVLVHQAPEIPRPELFGLVGGRLTQGDPGVVTPREIDQVFDALQSDLDAEQSHPAVSPETLRLMALRKVLYVLLEASGVHLSVAYDLTMGDIALLAPGADCLRVPQGCALGRTRTAATAQFIPLEGALWARTRHEVEHWLAHERSRVADREVERLPLLAREPGDPRRFSRVLLTRRIDVLLQWSTGDLRAHAGWLRKTRVTARHEAALGHSEAGRSSTPPTAASVYAALRSSGHVAMSIPMTHELHDPSIAFERSLRDGLAASRAAILQLTGLAPSPLDMAWQRTGGPDSPDRLRVVLARLKMTTPSAPAGRITSPPPLRRASALTPQHLAAYARARAHGDARPQAQLRAGLTDVQVDQLEQTAAHLVCQKGVTPWPLPGLRQRRCVMSIPRAMKGTERLYALLEAPPPEPLARLADTWAQQGIVQTLYEPRVLMALHTAQHQADARWLIDSTGVALVLGQHRDVEVLQAPTGRAPSQSHAAGVKWVLALIWLWRRLLEPDPRP